MASDIRVWGYLFFEPLIISDLIELGERDIALKSDFRLHSILDSVAFPLYCSGNWKKP